MTFVKKVAEGHFTLSDGTYEADRGVPGPMLDRAKEILEGKESAGPLSTSYTFCGESLTMRLK